MVIHDKAMMFVILGWIIYKMLLTQVSNHEEENMKIVSCLEGALKSPMHLMISQPVDTSLHNSGHGLLRVVEDQGLAVANLLQASMEPTYGPNIDYSVISGR